MCSEAQNHKMPSVNQVPIPKNQTKFRFVVIAVPLIFMLSAIFPKMGDAKSKPTRVECDVHVGPCSTYLAGEKMTLDISPKPVKAMHDLTFTVTFEGIKPRSNPHIDLGMPGMNMGRNRVMLQPAGEALYQGTGIIVRCPSGRRTWKATVTVPDTGSVEFVFDVIY